MEYSRAAAVDRLEALVETVERETMPVPVREIWVLGDLALGLDPVERLDVYLRKDILLEDDPAAEAEFADQHGIQGVGRTVRAEWATAHPEAVRASNSGYAAPEQCLAAHLVDESEPIHLEICNASFEDNVRQRVEGATARGTYDQLLDPRAVCLWVAGERASDAFEKLRAGEYAFPTLGEALGMLGLDEHEREIAASAVAQYRESATGRSVRGDVL